MSDRISGGYIIAPFASLVIAYVLGRWPSAAQAIALADWCQAGAVAAPAPARCSDGAAGTLSAEPVPRPAVWHHARRQTQGNSLPRGRAAVFRRVWRGLACSLC